MNVVFIVPTGVGAEIGGHSGDATPAAKLIASLCNKLFIHPNVVNAADTNEMTENMLYVEGSILDRFLEGQIGLEEVHQNKILVAVSGPISPEMVNAISGARATIGADISIVELNTPIEMIASVVDNIAGGTVSRWQEAVDQVSSYDFDVLIVCSPIITKVEEVVAYLSSQGGVNIWGGVEAKLSKLMSERLGKPVIHAPIESVVLKQFKGVVDPRKAAEMVSTCYLHCCLKGAHRAPKVSMKDSAYWNTDIDFMITPPWVFGRPHTACMKARIPIIVVEENMTTGKCRSPDIFIKAKNYLEAAGIISAKKAGVLPSTVTRPLKPTVVRENQK